jgi:ABC-2 type transport system permease protein
MFRVAWLVVAFGVRRSRNRLSALHRRKSKPNAGRDGTARKAQTGGLLVFVFSALFLFSGVTQATALVHRIAAAAERRDAADINALDRVDHSTMRWLDWAEDRANSERFGEWHDPSWQAKLRLAFDREAQDEGIQDQDEITRRSDLRLQLFAERGRSGFRERALRRPSRDVWYGARDSREMLAPLGLVALLLSLTTALLATAGANQDLAKVEWSLEWWFTFPVPARGLLLARVLETAFATPFAWFLLLPFFSVTLWCAGFGWLGIPLGALSAAYVGILAGCLRVVAETGLRRWLALRNVARLQALLSVVAVLPMVAALATVSPEWLDEFSRVATALPSWLLLGPLAPLSLAAGGARAWQGAVGCITFACAATAAATTFGGFVLRDGLTTSAGPNQGSRGRAPAADRQWPWSLGAMARKELSLLFRDRTLFSQTFVVPALVLGMQLLLNRGLARSLTSSPQHAAAMAFGTAAFVLSTGACNTLAVEVPVLWLYFTIPKPLTRLFVDKAVFWSCLASLVAGAVFIGAAASGSWPVYRGLPTFALALLGVTLNAFIATGIGVLGTQALETDARRRISASMTYLYMLLAGSFAYALYAPSAWAKFAQVVLSALLASAIWQKVRDHAPFLLDPNDQPAPTIAVADGVIAALAFFILQGLLVLLFLGFDYAPGASLLLAFSVAGVIVAGAALLSFWSLGVPNVLATVGLQAPKQGMLRAILSGVAGGLACGLVAKGYLMLTDHVDVLRRMRDETISFSNDEHTAVWFAVLAIFVAPIFEEFIFRGVLFGGFRRSFGALPAAVSSALVFAIVHPAIASAPVFLLGFVAALVYERARSLVAPMAAHMTYNAIVVGLAFIRH